MYKTKRTTDLNTFALKRLRVLLLKLLKQMVFLKLVHTESQVNHKTQPFWIKMVHLVPNVQTLAGHFVGTIHLAPTTALHFHTVHKTALDFLLFAKMRLEIDNTICAPL